MYSKKPSFKTELPSTPISEFVMRIVTIETDESWEILQIKWLGSCVSMSSNLVITARHVIDQYFKDSSSKKDECYWIWIIQFLDWGESYAIWEIEQASSMFQNIDIILLHLRPFNEEAGLYMKNWKHMSLDVLPPPIWSRIFWVGYHNSEGKVIKNIHWGVDIVLNDSCSTTVGEVIEIYEPQRDSIMLNFPCFMINAKFELGMSGWPIINDEGKICWIICSGHKIAKNEEEAISFASILRPVMVSNINTKLLSPTGEVESVRILDLAKKWLISIKNWQRVKINAENTTIEIDKYLETEKYNM